MKRLNLILIVAAFALTTACTETEKVLPYGPTQEVEFTPEYEPEDQNTANTPKIKHADVVIEKAPNLPPDLVSMGHHDENPAKTNDENTYYGELLPASFVDCGTFIRRSDGLLFQVLNMKVPQAYAKTGSKVKFGYTLEKDLQNDCFEGPVINVTSISFLQTKANDKATTRNNTSANTTK